MTGSATVAAEVVWSSGDGDVEVSVCLPVYNGRAFLDTALRAVAGQTFKSFEVVVVDDGSRDGSAQVAAELLAELSLPGQVVRIANRGCEPARDVACGLARGCFLAPLDCDDEWDADYLQRMVSALKVRSGVEFAYCDVREVDEQGQTLGLKSALSPWIDFSLAADMPGDVKVFDNGAFFPLLLQGQVTFPPCTVFTKALHARVGGYDNGVLQQTVSLDWDFALRCARETAVAYVDAPLLKKTRHGGNISGDAMNTAICDVRVMEGFLRRTDLSRMERGHATKRAAVRMRDVSYAHYEAGDHAQARKWVIRSMRARPSIGAARLAMVLALPRPLFTLLRRVRGS